MPLTKLNDDYTASPSHGVKFWMADEGRPVLCRVSREALRDHADRLHFEGTDERVFKAHREVIEQIASDTYDSGASVDQTGSILVTSEALDRVGRSA